MIRDDGHRLRWRTPGEGVRILDNAPGGSSDFRQLLLTIWHDPQVRKRAVTWAGDRGLAEDALQTAYCQVVAVRHPDRIEKLRAYFLRVLRNEILNQRSLRRAVPVENPEDALDPDQPTTVVCGPAQARPVDETVCASVQGHGWLKRLTDQRDALLAAIPARSEGPARYRAVIYCAAEQVLRDGIGGQASDSDSNDAFRAAYPGYFDQPGASPNLCHQRFRRAREDVRALLRAFVRREEL
jgi:DNA-directed RNA polymerase specialized sigma24 family protein